MKDKLMSELLFQLVILTFNKKSTMRTGNRRNKMFRKILYPLRQSVVLEVIVKLLNTHTREKQRRAVLAPSQFFGGY